MQYSLFERSYNWPVGTLLVQSAAGLELASTEQVLAEAHRLADSILKGPLMDRPELAREFFGHKLHLGLERSFRADVAEHSP